MIFSQSIFFKYLQISSFIFKIQKSLTLPNLTSLEEIAVNNHSKKGLISRFYDTITDSSKTTSENKRLAWSEDLNSVISVEDWRKVCLRAQTQSINSHLKLIQYKWLMRTYVTPYLMNKFDPNNPDACVECGEKGTLIHCLWECPQIQIFWTEVLNTLSFITGVKIKMCPQLCILGIFPHECKLNKENEKMTVYCLLQAKYNIATS